MEEKDKIEIDTIIKANKEFVAQIAKAQSLFQEFATVVDEGLSSYLKVFQEVQTAAAKTVQDAETAAYETLSFLDRLKKYAPAGITGLLGIPDEERKKVLSKDAEVAGIKIEKEDAEAASKFQSSLELFALAKDQKTNLLKGYVEDAEAARKFQSSLELLALVEDQKADLLKEYAKEREDLRNEELASVVISSQMHAWAEQSRANIVNSAYKSMEGQMLSLVETGRFSTEAFGEIIYQQVKMELVALSAKSAVQTLYYTALGFGLLAMQNPLAYAAFNAAAGFALISGATYGAAASVQAAFWGQEEYAPPASSTGRRASGASLKGAAAPSTPLAGYATDLKVKAPQNITIQIYNPLSEQNWQKIVEDNIVPAINSASERNIAVTVKNMGG